MTGKTQITLRSRELPCRTSARRRGRSRLPTPRRRRRRERRRREDRLEVMPWITSTAKTSARANSAQCRSRSLISRAKNHMIAEVKGDRTSSRRKRLHRSQKHPLRWTEVQLATAAATTTNLVLKMTPMLWETGEISLEKVNSREMISTRERTPSKRFRAEIITTISMT